MRLLRFGSGLNHCGSVTLHTRRLTLRRFSRADTEAMFRNWASDPDVTRFLLWRFHTVTSETREVIEYWLSQYHRRDFYEWAIVPDGMGEPIGSCGASKVWGKKGVWEIGYCLGKQWWGMGYGTEAAAAVIDLLFEKVGCRELIAMHELGNDASGRVMLKCGMQPIEGKIQLVRSDHGLLRCQVYRISRAQWAARCPGQQFGAEPAQP